MMEIGELILAPIVLVEARILRADPQDAAAILVDCGDGIAALAGGIGRIGAVVEELSSRRIEPVQAVPCPDP